MIRSTVLSPLLLLLFYLVGLVVFAVFVFGCSRHGEIDPDKILKKAMSAMPEARPEANGLRGKAAICDFCERYNKLVGYYPICGLPGEKCLKQTPCGCIRGCR